MNMIKGLAAQAAKINWASILAVLLVIAGVVFALVHRSDVAISMGLGAIAMSHLAHLADKDAPRA